MKEFPRFLALLGTSGALLLRSGSPCLGATQHFAFRAPSALRCQADDSAAADLAKDGKSSWLKAWPENGSTNYMLLSSRLVVQLETPAQLNALIAGTGLEISRTITPNTFILQAPDSWKAAQEAHRLAALPHVLCSYPVVRRQGDLHGPYYPQPTETNFQVQWYLEDRYLTGASAGPDLNVRAAWPWTLGQGVTVALADTGVEMAHQELSNNVVAGPHYNFVLQSTNALPVARTASAAHGTEVAGLVGASIDTFRMAGVAPRAQLASWVIFDANITLAPDDVLMAMYEYASNTVSVQNHSWGLLDTAVTQGGPTLLEQIGISNAITFGRNGLGVVMVRSAGNGRTQGVNADDSLYGSDPRVICVAAMRFDGRAASYSSPGASILVSAPSGDTANNFGGLFTTDLIGTDGANQVSFYPPNQDLSDYNFYQPSFGLEGFSGTSASAPLVSGIGALLLSANSNLTYRDVQQILLLSARQYDLADPDLVTNGAGFLVSHNQGFGVPDAGMAVNLARNWSNRPPATDISFTATNPALIPPDGLHVLVSGPGITGGPLSFECLPDAGPHADTPTPMLPLANLGVVTGPITQNLTNMGALIGRGGATFSQSITYAAQAGAAFAIVYNDPANTNDPTSGDQLVPMGGTDFVPIPAVFIGNTDGLTLSNLFLSNPLAVAQIHLQSINYTFTVTNTLVCEHVGLTVNASNPIRGQLRITLVSPMGSRSVLQRYNADTNPGPVNWTYYSTHHFFESTAGTWTAYISDEGAGNNGTVTSVSLSLSGVPIVDTDADGLDDNWENHYFGSLAMGPKDDPDQDGYSNMREQIMGTSPVINNNLPFTLDFSSWNPTNGRLSWPASAPYAFQIRAGTNPASLAPLTNLPGKWPVSEFFINDAVPPFQFFQIRAIPPPK